MKTFKDNRPWSWHFHLALLLILVVGTIITYLVTSAMGTAALGRTYHPRLGPELFFPAIVGMLLLANIISMIRSKKS